MVRGASAQSVEHYFYATGHTQLVENAKQIIFDRMLGKLEAAGDFAVGETFGQTSNDIDFTRRKQRSAIAAEVGQRRLSQSFEHELQFAAARPYLTRVDALDALGQQAEWFGPAKHALGASPERFNDCCPLGRVEQHDHARRRRLRPELAKQIEPSRMLFSEPRTDHHHLRFLALNQTEDCRSIGRRLDHLKLRISSQGLDQKLRAHGSAVRS